MRARARSLPCLGGVGAGFVSLLCFAGAARDQRIAPETRLCVLARAQILHPTLARDEDDLFAVPFVFVAADFTFVLDDLVFHARKEVGPVVVIVLRPAVERMIVALGALQARAEEHLRRRFGARGGIAVGAVKVRRGTAVGAAAGSDEFAHEFVQRLVFGDALANPMVEVL